MIVYHILVEESPMSADDTTGSPVRSHAPLSSAQRARLRDLVYGSMSAEFATCRDGKPATFPLTPFYDELRETIVVSSPVAYAGKVRSVERNPRVSLLLHDTTGEYLLTGDAVVRDDVDANARYVRELNDREPPSSKRTANVEKYEFVDSRVGNALVGWLDRRLVIEITPRSIRRLANASFPPTIPAWPAVEMASTEASQYERAVLTVVGDDGYPVIYPITTVRIRDGSAVIEPEPVTDLDDGQPACLLFHWHDDASIYLGQRLVRGRFRFADGAPRFAPASSSTLRNDGPIDTLRFIVDGKRRTRASVAERANGASPRSTDKAETPPGPDGWPLLGNTVGFLRDPFAFYEALPSYGDVVQYRIGWNTWVALLHPDDIERVLVNDSHRFERYNFEDLGFDFIPGGLFFTKGERWRRQRQLIQPAFAPARVAAFSETVVSTTAAMVDEWDDGDTVVANHAFSELTLDVLTATLFDVDLADRRAVVTAAAEALADRVDTRSLSAVLPGWVPTSRNREFERRMARFDTMVAALIDERRAEGGDRDDLLSTLLQQADATADDDASLSDEELRDQLMTFLFAGHETSALVLTYALHSLAKHDDVRRTLETELEAVCGDSSPTVEDIPSLEYTEKVLKETMRYYPPVYVLFRETLEDVTVDGYLLPAGTKLALPQFLVHSDDRWWDDPETFRPARWTDELDETLPEYAYFPFGGGPRHCVGMRFATMFLTLSLATIARLARFDLESDPEPTLRMGATLTPAEDVELRVRKRT